MTHITRGRNRFGTRRYESDEPKKKFLLRSESRLKVTTTVGAVLYGLKVSRFTYEMGWSNQILERCRLLNWSERVTSHEQRVAGGEHNERKMSTSGQEAD